MNYTGRPSISGCRPVLSLYPTHRFCQYLLLIFITFTNSFLFNRAFSTNSRSPLSHAAGVTGPGCALSGASRQLPQRESPWQAPQSERFRQRLPYQGSCLRSRLRGCTKTEPDREPLLDSTSPSALTRCHCPGCGSQRLLRCRSHPAGRGPNSSSLFPPLAAVVAVAPTEGRLWHSAKFSFPVQSFPLRQRLPY